MDVIEWCRLHDIWYLKIDLEIPDVCISEAQAVYDEGFFVDHRYGDGDSGGKVGLRQASLGLFTDPKHRLRMVSYKKTLGHGLTEETVKWGWTEVQEVHRKQNDG